MSILAVVSDLLSEVVSPFDRIPLVSSSTYLFVVGERFHVSI